ncbi:g5765 [Coccomyxa elongata]
MANATQLFSCPGSACKGTPYYSGDDVGDAACLNGTKGPVCAICDEGYYLFSGGCSSCQKVGKATLAMAVVIVTLGLILIFMFDLPGSDDVGGGPMTKYKIITTHFQLLSFLRDYDVLWPAATITLFSYSDSFNLGISVTAPECYVKGYSFFTFYIATMAMPALALLLCIVVFIVASTAHKKLSNAPSFQREEEQEHNSVQCGFFVLSQHRRAKLLEFFLRMKGRCYKNVFYLITLVYPRCIGLLVVFAIGVPAFYLYTMYKIRNRLDELEIKNRFGFLYGGYSYQYWETWDMLRKLILGGIPVFIAVQPLGSMQAVLAQVVIIAFMAATIGIHPFLDKWDNVISISSMGILWLLLLTGEMMKWAHLGTRTENLIAIGQLALSSGVGGIVMAFVAVNLSMKAYQVIDSKG